MKRYLTAIASVLLISTSCIKENDIRISDIEYAGLSNPNKPEVTITVENDSNHKVQIKKARFDFSKNGHVFLQTLFIDKVVIPKCADTVIDLPVRIRTSDPLAATSILSDWRSEPEAITITGEAVVRAGVGKKKFRFRDMPISQFLSTFGIE